ncbi:MULTISPECIES: trypsin-like serine protease [unclassified Streptomyces]|uniref:trypsin-like serine protease n=1 Tax=unclassified Streptomyces TaxID=2593676 RepID=UPI002557A3A8|nr:MULTISPECIES: trypsin-like serine protease [unclassified Streptomyces]WRZ65042.1 trypsin-like serine protease [Streptomyces sp. NBC_01257]
MRLTRRSRVLAAAASLVAAPLALCAVPAAAVTGPASEASDTTHAYTAQIVVGTNDRGCSGVLVDSEWLLTAASCFAADPAQSLSVTPGVPASNVTATIGRTDLTSTSGAQRKIVELVPRADRDVVLARLDRPVTDVAPAPLATTAPAAGEELKFAGYGRSKDEWAPLKLHTGTYTVDSAAATTAAVTGKDAAACMGDSGGPVLRGTGAAAQLVALNSQSFQGGCFGTDETQTSTAGVTARVDDLKSWIDSKVGAPAITDFNGDGVEDIAVADAKATVGGKAGAGLVRMVYGGGKGIAQIDQDLDWVGGAAEANDGFGETLATVDYNQDGYTDLVVGSPGEALNGAANAGMVDILFGGPSGLGTGAVKHKGLEQGAGTGAISVSTSEAGDSMGKALAAGTTAEGRPWILIGLPGESVGPSASGVRSESVGSGAAAGMAFYVYGDTSRSLHQDLPVAVPGAPEAGDRFGAAVAGDGNYFAIGAPGEDLDASADAGQVALFSHTLDADGRPTSIGGVVQGSGGVTGAAETGDEFGAALAMTAYRASASAGANTSMLAIGSPGETTTVAGAAKAGAGRAVLVRINADSTWTYLRELRQGEADDTVSGTSEAGDRMGESLTAINTAPRAVATTSTLLVAVGTPGEAIGTETQSGAIHTFSMLGSAGDNDLWIEAGDGDGIPGTSKAGQRLGESIHFTGTHLYAGLPYGPSTYGSLYALPIGNVIPGGTDGAVTTYQPGTGGLPAAGDEFGHAAR